VHGFLCVSPKCRRKRNTDDETAISTSMTRRGGRSARGQRLVCKVPFGAWQSVTMVAALRHDRMTAPMTLNGAMTGDSFRSYIAQVLGRHCGAAISS
jgi:hypothetical protein